MWCRHSTFSVNSRSLSPIICLRVNCRLSPTHCGRHQRHLLYWLSPRPVSLAEFFIQHHPHPIIESHTETPPSLRIYDPFPALLEHSKSLKLSETDPTEHAHIPYIPILIHARSLVPHIPKTQEEKNAFKALILSLKFKQDEENFDEAHAQRIPRLDTNISSFRSHSGYIPTSRYQACSTCHPRHCTCPFDGTQAIHGAGATRTACFSGAARYEGFDRDIHSSTEDV